MWKKIELERGRCTKGDRKLLKQTHLLTNFYVDCGGSNCQHKTGNDFSALLAHCMNARQGIFKLNVFCVN